MLIILSVTEFAEKAGITMANISVLKIRKSQSDPILDLRGGLQSCWTASPAMFSNLKCRTAPMAKCRGRRLHSRHPRRLCHAAHSGNLKTHTAIGTRTNSKAM